MMRLRRCAAAAGRRLAAEGGYSLSELIVVLVIIGIMHAFRRRDAVPTGPDLAIGLLTILNVGIAVFWT